MKKPVAFMSYAHRDNKDGRLTRLRERLSDEVGMRIGEDFEIFQDRNAILWGQNWKERIEDSLDQVTFLISIITPGFFKSPHCRDELRRFLDREKKLGRKDLVLPIYYIDTPLLNDEAKRESDELARAVYAHQYADWRELRNKPWTAPKIEALEQLATQVCDALERVQESETSSTPIEPMPAEPTVQETEDRQDQLHRYRESVELAWADRELYRREVARLRDLTSKLELSPSTAAEIEREVMGATKEAILKRQERAAREERECQNRLDQLYAEARRLHRDQQWQAVVDVFDQIHTLDLEYPDFEGLLTSAREALRHKIRPSNIEQLQLLHSLPGHTYPVWSVAFSPDGSLLASGSYGNTVRLWRVGDGKLLSPLRKRHTAGPVLSVAFSPDGSLLASGSRDNTVQLWRVENGELLRSPQGHSGWVYSVAFSPDGSLLASGSEDSTVRLWRVKDGKPLRLLERHMGWVYSVAFSPDGSLLASSSADGTVRLWRIA